MRRPRLVGERRKTVRELLTAADAGDLDATAVLIDAVHAVDPELSENLALAFQGRHSHGARRGRPLETGNTRSAEIRGALVDI